VTAATRELWRRRWLRYGLGPGILAEVVFLGCVVLMALDPTGRWAVEFEVIERELGGRS
jgi:hypothetical protein